MSEAKKTDDSSSTEETTAASSEEKANPSEVLNEVGNQGTSAPPSDIAVVSDYDALTAVINAEGE